VNYGTLVYIKTIKHSMVTLDDNDIQTPTKYIGIQ